MQWRRLRQLIRTGLSEIRLPQRSQQSESLRSKYRDGSESRATVPRDKPSSTRSVIGRQGSPQVYLARLMPKPR